VLLSSACLAFCSASSTTSKEASAAAAAQSLKLHRRTSSLRPRGVGGEPQASQWLSAGAGTTTATGTCSICLASCMTASHLGCCGLSSSCSAHAAVLRASSCFGHAEGEKAAVAAATTAPSAAAVELGSLPLLVCMLASEAHSIESAESASEAALQ
jgi:hypothetical protein